VAGHDVDGTTNVQQTSTTARHDTSWSFFSLNRSSPAGREGHPQDPAHGETGRLRVHRDGADHHPLNIWRDFKSFCSLVINVIFAENAITNFE